MDADLVEKITRLVLLKLNEYSGPSSMNLPPLDREVPEYPPLTERELRKWQELSSVIRGQKGPQTPPHLAPLSEEEIKMWKELSASFRFGRQENTGRDAQADYHPLTQEELQAWGKLAGRQ
jgi:hypothetical protein